MLLQVLEEAEEYRVDCHVVHREEGGGDGVRPQHDDDHRDEVVVKVNI